jgi:hypothetical protein
LKEYNSSVELDVIDLTSDKIVDIDITPDSSNKKDGSAVSLTFSSDKNRSGEKIGLEKNVAAQKQAIGTMAEKNGSSERNVAAQKQAVGATAASLDPSSEKPKPSKGEDNDIDKTFQRINENWKALGVPIQVASNHATASSTTEVGATSGTAKVGVTSGETEVCATLGTTEVADKTGKKRRGLIYKTCATYKSSKKEMNTM